MKVHSVFRISALTWKRYLLFLGLISILTAHAQAHSVVGVNNTLPIIHAYTLEAPWSNAIIEPVQKWMNEADIPEHFNMLMIGNAGDFCEVEDTIFREYAKRAQKPCFCWAIPRCS